MLYINEINDIADLLENDVPIEEIEKISVDNYLDNYGVWTKDEFGRKELTDKSINSAYQAVKWGINEAIKLLHSKASDNSSEIKEIVLNLKHINQEA